MTQLYVVTRGVIVPDAMLGECVETARGPTNNSGQPPHYIVIIFKPKTHERCEGDYLCIEIKDTTAAHLLKVVQSLFGERTDLMPKAIIVVCSTCCAIWIKHFKVSEKIINLNPTIYCNGGSMKYYYIILISSIIRECSKSVLFCARDHLDNFINIDKQILRIV